MQPIELPLVFDIESRNGLPFSDAYILNGYCQIVNGKKKIAKRPGLSLIHQYTAGVGQGAFTMSGIPYVIIHDVIYMAVAPWTGFAIPTITTADLPYDIKANPPYITTAFTVLKTTAGMWTFNGAVATKVTNANYPAVTARGIGYLDGTYYVLTPAGSLMGSALSDPTVWTALSAVPISNKTGTVVAVLDYSAFVVAMGQYSTTFYWDAANPVPGIPVSYAPNMTQSIGCANASSIASIGDLTFFVSRTADGRSVSVIYQGQIQNISTASLDSILDLDAMVTVYAYCLALAGRFFYVLSLAATGITMVYNATEKHWTYWASGTTAAPVAVMLTLGSDLTTVTGVLSSGTTVAGSLITITGATNTLFNGQFVVTSAVGTQFTFPLTYAVYLLDQNGNYLVDASGNFLVATQLPLPGPVAGATMAAISSYTYFHGVAATNGNLVIDAATGALSQLTTTAYRDIDGPIDLNIVTPNFKSATQSDGLDIATIAVEGDKVNSIGYLRYTDNDYTGWSQFRPISLISRFAKLTRQGRTYRRAYHFRHVDNLPLRVEKLVIEEGE